MVRAIAGIQLEHKHAGIENVGAPAVPDAGLHISGRMASLGTNQGKTPFGVSGPVTYHERRELPHRAGDQSRVLYVYIECTSSSRGGFAAALESACAAVADGFVAAIALACLGSALGLSVLCTAVWRQPCHDDGAAGISFGALLVCGFLSKPHAGSGRADARGAQQRTGRPIAQCGGAGAR